MEVAMANEILQQQPRVAIYGRVSTSNTLGYFTGMRLGEVLSRRWAHIDLLNNMILLWGDETKNSEARPVPIVPQLRRLLVAQMANRPEGYPFVSYRLDPKGHPVRIKGFRKAWYRACIEVGLGRMEPKINPETGEAILAKPRSDRKSAKPKVKMVYRGLIFHDLRRSCVRNLVRAGVPEKVAMEISGHRTRSTFERYNITSGKDLMEASQKLSVFLENGDISGTVCTDMQQGYLPVF
jgi:integrase